MSFKIKSDPVIILLAIKEDIDELNKTIEKKQIQLNERQKEFSRRWERLSDSDKLRFTIETELK